jgi:hypothetical protein
VEVAPTELTTKAGAIPGLASACGQSAMAKFCPGSRPQPGHTPGHTGWLIASGSDALLIWGDIVHVAEVQFARPDAAPAQVACDRFGCQPVKKGCSVRTSIFKEETQQTVVCN